jgi:hypothetical protein
VRLLFWLFSGFFPRPDLSRLYRVEVCRVNSQLPSDVPCYNIFTPDAVSMLMVPYVRFVCHNVLHSLKHMH